MNHLIWKLGKCRIQLTPAIESIGLNHADESGRFRNDQRANQFVFRQHSSPLADEGVLEETLLDELAIVYLNGYNG